MPGLDDDDERLRELADAYPGEEDGADELAPLDAPPEVKPEIDADALQALLEQAVAAKGGPSMEVGPVSMSEPGRPAEQAPAMSGLEGLLDAYPEAPRAPATSTQPRPVLAGQPVAPKDAASYAMDTSSGKQRVFGVDDQRQDLAGNAARVGELYKPEDAATGPGAHEQQFLAGSERPTAQDVRRAWIVQSLFGQPGDNFKAVDMVRGMQQDHDQGLARARAADAAAPGAGHQVDRATAEALGMFGLSPEAAVSARENSPVIQLMRSGGLNVAKGLRGQDTQVHTTDVKEVGDTWRNDANNATDLEQTDRNNVAKIEAAKIRKRTGAGGGGGLSPDVHAAYLAQQANVPLETAQAFVGGTIDPKTVDPKTLEGMQVASALFKNAAPKDRAQMVKTRMGAEGGNSDAAGRAASIERGSPKFRLKVKQDMAEIGTPLRHAIIGYNSLSPKAKQLVTQVGLGGNLSMLRDAGVTPQEQAAIGAVVEQINASVKALSGAAVSASEWSRVGAAMGISGEGYNPYKSAGALGAWLARGKAAFDAQKKVITSEFPNMFTGGE